MMDHEPIHITVPGNPDDPRVPSKAPPGVIVHRGPPLHPDDMTVKDGIPVTSVARTLVDMAEESTKDELRAMFARARAMGLLVIDDVVASAERAEWRPSLPMLYEVIGEFREED